MSGNNKFKIRLNDGNGILLLVALILTTFYIYRDLGITTVLGWVIIFVYELFIVAMKIGYNSKVTLPREKIIYVLICSAIVLFFLRLSSRHDGDERLYLIAMAVMAIAVILAEPSLREIMSVCRLFKIMTFLIAIWILFFKVAPGLYWSTVYKVIDPSCQELAAYYIPRGYGIPLGGSFTIAYYIMTVGLLFVVADIFIGAKKYIKEKCIDMIYIVVVILAMVAEGRRGELMAVMVAILFLFLISKDTTHFFLKISLILILIFIVLASYKYILIYMKTIPFFSRYAKSIEGILQGNDITSGRTELWVSAWKLFKEKPICGIGFGGFAYHVTSAFRSIHGQDVMDVHNCTLQLLCENGIVGTIILLIPMGMLFSRVYHRLVAIKKKAHLNEWYMWGCKLDIVTIGIQIFFLILSQLDPAFYKPVFWGFYGLSIILGCSSNKMVKAGNCLISTIKEEKIIEKNEIR